MNRREIIKSGGAVGVVALAGCTDVLGEKEDVEEAVRDGADELLAAYELLETEYEAFGPIEDEVEFDADAVHASIAAANERLDDAEAEEPRLDETAVEIENLRSAADLLEALTRVGDSLADAHDETHDALDNYDADEFEAAADDFEAALDDVEDADGHLTEAEDAHGEIDADAITTLDVDVDGLETDLSVARRTIDGYSVIVSGSASFTKGAREFTEAEAESDAENHGSAAETYQTSEQYFRAATESFERYEAVDVPAEVEPVAADMTDVSIASAELASALQSMSNGLAALDTGDAYMDADRFDDAIDEFEVADSELSDTRSRLADANAAFEEIDDEGDFFDVIEVESRRQDFQHAEAAVETLDHMVTGMIDFARGAREMNAGFDASDQENFAEAASHLDDAKVRFGDAEDSFADAEEAAPPDLQPDAISLVCFAGALRDGSELLAEANRAADDGDWDTANQKFEEAGDAFERCE